MHTQGILVISNEKLYYKLVATLLQRAGYTVVTAKDMPSVHAALAPLYPAIILLDMQFSVSDIPSIIQYLNNTPATNTIPCIGMTISKEEGDEQNAQVAGYQGVILLQPFQAKPLLTYIDTFLTKHDADK